MRSIYKVMSAVVLLMVLVSLLWTSLPAQALDKDALKRGLMASVKLIVLDANNKPVGGCSGTVLDNTGYILTNFHCVGQTDVYGPDREFGLKHGELLHPQGLLGVAITENARQLPVPSYIAQFIAGNPDQDVAVLRIVSDLDGNATPETLPLVPAILADSDLVDVGDEVSVIGYPGVGGETVTFTEGRIAGFMDDDYDGLMDWFKTDALINGGNSGGTAVNELGEVVGIPSGKVFDASRGDSLHLIKPLNQAVAVIERARAAGKSQIIINKPNDNSNSDSLNIAADDQIGQLTFGTGFDDYTSAVSGEATVFPSGTTEIHAAMPYQNMRDGISWGYIWLYQGQEALSEPNLRWDQGESGVLDLYIYSEEAALPDGEFGLQILLNGKVVQEGRFVIGSQTPIDEPQKPTPPESKDVFVSGRIIDYDTGRPLADAMIVFLVPGYTVADFDAAADTGEMLASFGITDANGQYFSLLPLERGQTYTVIAGLDGYQRLAYDDALEILPDDPDVVEIEDIALQKY